MTNTNRYGLGAGKKITIDGITYYQPVCRCKGNSHIYYVRPIPQVLNIPISKIKFPTHSRKEEN